MARPEGRRCPGRETVVRLVLVGVIAIGLTPAAFAAIDSVVPPAASVVQGGSVSASVAIEPKEGTSQLVAVGAPAGVSVGFSPSTVSSGTTVTMSVSVSADVPAGTYVITIREIANESIVDEAQLALTVTAAPATTSPPESTTTVPSESTTTSPPVSTTTVPSESTTTSPPVSIPAEQPSDDVEAPVTTTVDVPPAEDSSPPTTVPLSTPDGAPWYVWTLGGLGAVAALVLGVFVLLRRRCRRGWKSAIDLLFTNVEIVRPSQVLVSGPVMPGSVIRQQLVEGDPVELVVAEDAVSPVVFMIDDEPSAWLLGSVRYGWLEVGRGRVEVVSSVNPMTVFPADGSVPGPFHSRCTVRRHGVDVILGEGEFLLGSPPGDAVGDTGGVAGSDSALVGWSLDLTCGPDVTNALIALQTALFLKWAGLSAAKRKSACSGLTQVRPGRRSTPAFVNAWEIEEMGPGGALRDGDYASTKPPCGKEACHGTVEVNGHCYLAEEVNYVAFGWMTRLCGWSKAAMKRKVRQWKALYIAQLWAKYWASVVTKVLPHLKKADRDREAFVQAVKWGQKIGWEEHINKYALAWAVAGWNGAPLSPAAKMPGSSSQQACRCDCPYAWPFPLSIYWENLGTIVGLDPPKLRWLPPKGKGKKYYYHPFQGKSKAAKTKKGSHGSKPSASPKAKGSSPDPPS